MKTAAGDKTRETRTRWGKYISIARIPTSLGREAGATSWLVEALRATVMLAGVGKEGRKEPSFADDRGMGREKIRIVGRRRRIRYYIGKNEDETRPGYYFDGLLVPPPPAKATPGANSAGPDWLGLVDARYCSTSDDPFSGLSSTPSDMACFRPYRLGRQSIRPRRPCFFLSFHFSVHTTIAPHLGFLRLVSGCPSQYCMASSLAALGTNTPWTCTSS